MQNGINLMQELFKKLLGFFVLGALTLANVYSCQHQLDNQYAYERTQQQQWQAELDHNFKKGE